MEQDLKITLLAPLTDEQWCEIMNQERKHLGEFFTVRKMSKQEVLDTFGSSMERDMLLGEE
jgi:uncharacterized linocin/CFP29 family protein